MVVIDQDQGPLPSRPAADRVSGMARLWSPSRLLGLWTRAPVVPVIRLAGVIGGGGVASGRTLTLMGLAPAIRRAFAMRRAVAIALAINSPGGAPVQASLIAGRIRALATEHNLPVVAFIEDVGASGGYMLACAADEIFVDPCSIVGSIGVISAGFGFAGLIDKLGIERRLHAEGALKGMLDPFRPERPQDVERLKQIQQDIYAVFTKMVEARRAGRLKGSPADLFDGGVHAGERAVALGLADGLGDLRGIMRARFGERVRLVPVNGPPRWTLAAIRNGGLHMDSPHADGAGLGTAGPGAAAFTEGVIAAVIERIAFARYGL